ncbi:MAG: endolytic transglycosylase MltG [Pseudomonadota bacterium]
MLRVFKFLALLIVIGGVLLAWAAHHLWQDMQAALIKPLPIATTEYFVVPKGMNMRMLANTIAANGWVQEAFFIEIEARRQKVANKIQAGTYELMSADTPLSLLKKVVAGDTASLSFSIIEGMNIRDVMAQLAATPRLKQTLAELSPAEVSMQIAPEWTSLEGWIFPAIYSYEIGSTDTDLLRRAYSKMQTVLQHHWDHRAKELPYESPYEALIMASIIEKETGQAAERKQISGVFVRRLNKGMKLQTDPTVIYGIGESFDGNIRRKDLRTDTAYNTYTRFGLPPTPIAMPGEAAIEAALNPADGDALYFVAKGDGWHEFSATLKAHNAAVRKYQLKK